MIEFKRIEKDETLFLDKPSEGSSTFNSVIRGFYRRVVLNDSQVLWFNSKGIECEPIYSTYDQLERLYFQYNEGK